MPSAMEFMQRLVALMPRPRLNLIHFYGVLTSNAKLRKAVLPVSRVATAPAHSSDCNHLPAAREGTHALGAIFEAVIEEPAVIQRTRHAPGANRAAAIACTGPASESV